jgi:hypothetical protein
MGKPISDPNHILHVPALEQDRRIGLRLLVVQCRDADPKPGSVSLSTNAELGIPTPIVQLDLARRSVHSPLDQLSRDADGPPVHHGVPYSFPNHLQRGRRVDADAGCSQELQRIAMDILDLFFCQQA